MSSASVVSKNELSEQKYREKCKELKRRITEIEEHNEAIALSISRTTKSIQRLRLERSLLLEKLEERTLFKVDDSDGSVSPPLSPSLDGGAKKETEAGDGTGESAGPKKRVVPPRNPNMPKRPQNAYIIFCEVEKDRVRNELEHIQPGEPFDLTKAMAEAWKDLGAKGRSPFYALYEDDKLRYNKEMAAYSDPNATPSELREKQRAIKALKDLENKEKLAREQGTVPTSDAVDVAESEDVLRHSDEDIDAGSENFAMEDSDIGDNDVDGDGDEDNYDGYEQGMDTEPPSSMGIDPDDN
jgi:non-histone protein 10